MNRKKTEHNTREQTTLKIISIKLFADFVMHENAYKKNKWTYNLVARYSLASSIISDLFLFLFHFCSFFFF